MDGQKSNTRQPPGTMVDTGKKRGEKPAPDAAAKPTRGATMEEHLERLAELNLSSTYSSRSRVSPAIIRLLSAAAGVAVLLLLYLLFKHFM